MCLHYPACADIKLKCNFVLCASPTILNPYVEYRTQQHVKRQIKQNEGVIIVAELVERTASGVTAHLPIDYTYLAI